jgi:hypothetical protein
MKATFTTVHWQHRWPAYRLVNGLLRVALPVPNRSESLRLSFQTAEVLHVGLARLAGGPCVSP